MVTDQTVENIRIVSDILRHLRKKYLKISLEQNMQITQSCLFAVWCVILKGNAHHIINEL